MEYPSSSRMSGLSKPDAGLAEWTSKIKAMQRQVDADEELEQKRLTEEIAASRLARLRRSRGVGYGGRFNSVDISKEESTEFERVLYDPNASSTDDQIFIKDREKGQGDAMRKLTSNKTASAPLSTPRIQERSSLPSLLPKHTQPAIQVQKKPESVSLAAFIGGKATGPKLNRHAPQQDTHDPTRFEQRIQTTAPHPVFGKSGVAMVGMAATAMDHAELQKPPVRVERDRDRTLSDSPTVRGRMVESPVVSSQMAWSRERTMSTPSGATPLKSSFQGTTRPEPLRRPISSSSTPESRPKTPSQGPQTSTLASTTPPTSPPTISRYIPRQQPVPSGSTSPTRKSAVNTSSLARPIVPEARLSPQAPRIPSSQNRSPAFLRPPAQRDPTPSISRLQGRGFVQNMVRASTELESAGSLFSPSNEKGHSANGRKSAVLDRWQPSASSSSSSLPPPVSPKPIPLRKSRTVDSSLNAQPSLLPPKMLKSFSSSQSSLKSVSSLPSLSQSNVVVPSSRKPLKRMSVPESMPPEGAPGLGSSSTLISYIKPTKTGDDPLYLPAPVPSLDTDELGVRTSINGVTRERTAHKPYPPSELPAQAGQPLSHPTKDRARKPRKTKESSQCARETVSAEQRPGSIARSAVSSSTMLSSAPSQSLTSGQTTLDTGFLEPPDQPKQSPQPLKGQTPNIGRLSDRWANQNIIGVKSILPSKDHIPEETRSIVSKAPSGGIVGGRALPGLAKPQAEPTPSQTDLVDHISPAFVSQIVPLGAQDDPGLRDSNGPIDRRSLPKITAPDVILTPGPLANNEDHTPSTPTRHGRIPSTGNRATVMEVAQALHDQRHQQARQQDKDLADDGAMHSSKLIDIATLSIATRKNATSVSQAEKRKSSYEKYSAIILPPLQEEMTPAPSPAGTLSSTGQAHREQGKAEIPHTKNHRATLAEAFSPLATAELTDADADMVHFDHTDEPLPSIDIDPLLKSNAHSFVPDVNIRTISTELMSLMGNTATVIPRDTNVFYDTEVLGIIHRSKAISSGLVSTAVWVWRGKRSQAGEREERKLQELAKRYGTVLRSVQQYSEPSELVHLLGGQLAIRQGTRAHWTSENTAMHLVRSYLGVIFLDEHDLDVKNLCSGFSYCLSVLDTLYVWHGRGSTPRERHVALEYARSLAVKGSSVIELSEGEDDSDEMFWMILGDEEYAKADYWKWRRTASVQDPQAWRIDAKYGVHPVSAFLEESALQDSVYIIDCVWEYFVLVGRHARGNRQDIRLAVSLAMQLSDRIAKSRPYTPTIHVLILPTQLPLDFRLHFRDVDEASLNNNDVPGHMNIISCQDALRHLGRKDWEKAALKDHSMLPLGLNSSDIP